MRKWAKRVLGALASGGGLWAIVDRIVGLPGYISDIGTWIGWSSMIGDVGLLAGFGLLGGGALLATSDWWWPRLFRRQASLEFMAQNSELNRFNELLPLVQRQVNATQPSYIPIYNPIMHHAFLRDQEMLIAQLDALKIPHPPSDVGRAAWYNYVVRLELMVNSEKLAEARLERNLTSSS